MPRSDVRPLTHDLAVKAALQTIGKPVGFGDAPAGALSGVLDNTGPDYLVLYPLPGGNRDGSVSDPYADTELVYQVSITGRSLEGVRGLVGRLEPALLGVSITGRRVLRVVVDQFGAAGPDRDVGPPHPFLATPTVRLWTTPA